MNFKSMMTSFKRILKFGWQGFKRQANLSFATCFVLVITVSLVSSFFLFRIALNFLLDEVRGKADISVYFQENCEDEQMFELKDEVLASEAVKEAELINREQALERFIAKHQDEDPLMQSLIEVGANPFLASLNIKASGVDEYDGIVALLEQEKFQGLIEKIDYYKRKPIIERIFEITDFSNKAGIAIVATFVLMSILISFNTTRLVIDSQKDEVSVMRLGGAANSFIRGPFLVQGAICGLLSFLISFLMVGLLSFFLTPELATIFPELHFFNFFQTHFWTIILVQIGLSLALGIIPSYIAIKKYLRV